MIGYNTLLSWLLIVGKPVSHSANNPPWVTVLAYVAAIVFVIILLAAIYLMILATKQRKAEDRDWVHPPIRCDRTPVRYFSDSYQVGTFEKALTT